MRRAMAPGALLAGLALFASPAPAADPAPLATAPAIPPSLAQEGTPANVWSGPYGGAFAGYNRAEFDTPEGTATGDGAMAGVYGGYNLQSGPVVYGLEADIGAPGADVSTGGFFADSGVFGSLRGRVGVAVDPFLAYGTGGLALSENELSSPAGTDSAVSTGYTVGGGVETSFTDAVTGRLEYRYSDFGRETYDLGTTSVSSGFDEHSVRAGVALRF